MDISKHDFVKKFPEVADAILEADCIAIDAEFSGLRLNSNMQSQFDDQQARYFKLCQSAKEYTIIQYGVCAFKKISEQEYIAKPFNFYIFGGDTPTMNSQRSFLSSASSLQFLRSHNFDFNKWIDNGIPFYNFAETSSAVKRVDRPGTFVNRQNQINLNTLTKQQLKFVETTRHSINKWLQSESTSKPLIIQTNNSFIRRLVHQELQDGKYNGYLTGRLRDTKHMSIHKLSEEERSANMRVDNVQTELNFRRVIELINQTKCPVIVHNGYLDILHTVDQFWQYLPSSVIEFKNIANEMWSRTVDTKYLAEFHPHLKKCFNSTVLGSLYNTVSTELLEAEVSLKIADGYDRYSQDEDAQHEAGYDAFMTGSIFIGFARFILESEAKKLEREKSTKIKSGKEKNMDESDSDNESIATTLSEDGQVAKDTPDPSPFGAEILTSYYNRIFVARCDIPYIDLVNEEQMPVIEVPNRFYMTNVPEGITVSGIETLYPELRPMSVHWINTSTAWLIVKHDNRIELAKEGVLGEERVKPFLRGQARQYEGEALHITPDAAKIELFGFERWRTKPEFQTNGLQNGDVKEAQGNMSVDEDNNGAGEISSSTESDDSDNDNDEQPEKLNNDNTTPSSSRRVDQESIMAAIGESYIPVGGNAYDDLDIPLPPSFRRGLKRKATNDEEKEDSKKDKKKQR